MQTPAPGVALEPVQWSVRGEQRRAAGRPLQTWLHLHVKTDAWPTCQRCLLPFSQALTVDRALRFVDDEAQAEALDADSEDDVLALVPALDLRTLVEDELLLAWPIVPRHAQCSVPQHSTGDPGAPQCQPVLGIDVAEVARSRALRAALRGRYNPRFSRGGVWAERRRFSHAPWPPAA